ncbi:acetyltransferase (GNAT) family protein [Cytobacillus firmus]|uniref:Acetyltransferase (GNAT) family protein n=2 Tax=Cytobacillus TaxID=2675230 RepID=A0A366JUM1_CYTFI|nr:MULTISPECIES: GNAT family N-acetyltransferase [Cytobacillus]RBP92907.1 acetyltransferase (GNAT) family protein [Cytobacillus firmus]TDX42509.1 acetyltransferase (GNAT) family protein [Cytobacillus oceanisediminis]
MKLTILCTMPDAGILSGIIELHKNIFGDSEGLVSKMKSKPQLLVLAAVDGEKMIGYKMGYAIDEVTFYSWLGGVAPDYRKNGVASMLMEKQHEYLKETGYKVVRTKTMNIWRSMLILNIKHGFDVIETYTDVKGLHKIVLEKRLHN